MAIGFDPDRDLVFGKWSSASKTFVEVEHQSQANAIKLKLRHSVGGNESAPLAMLSLFGRRTVDVNADAVASLSVSAKVFAGNGDGTFTYWVPATSNPWLAGDRPGTIANANNPAKNPDFAGEEVEDDGVGTTKTWMTGTSGGGSTSTASTNYSLWGDYATKKSSPITAGGLKVKSQQTLSFANLNGGANNSDSVERYTADGNTDWIVSNYAGAENGKSDLVAPINSVVAVFLGDNEGNDDDKKVPETLNFTTPESRDFSVLKPKIGQVFFIGDGLRSNGEPQQFVAPPGAKKLYLGTMDGFEWNNNVGGFEVNTVVPVTISTVQ